MIYNILVTRVATYDEIIELTVEAASEYDAELVANDACQPMPTELGTVLRFVPLTQSIIEVHSNEVIECEKDNENDEDTIDAS